MTRSYDRIARAVFEVPWFLREREAAIMAEVVLERLAGGRLSDEQAVERVRAAQSAQGPRRGARTSGAVGVIPVYGVIMPRTNLMTLMSGGTSIEDLRSAFRDAVNDEAVGSIVFDVDSPGGAVDQVEEFATEIRDARGVKPMIAVSNTLMASAAYYLASQADEIVASPSSLTGSIGVYIEHVEYSKANELDGVTATFIRRPIAKADANGDEPLTDGAKAHLQQIVDDYYGQFTAAVAKGRGVTPAAVRAGYGEGRVLTAQRALSAGLVDRVGTLEDSIRRLATGKGPAPRAAAQVTDSTTDSTTGMAGVQASSIAIDELDPSEELETPDRSVEAEAALALARAKANRR